MVYAISVLTQGFVSTAPVLTTLCRTASVAKDFFLQLFMYPEKAFISALFLAGAPVAICVSCAYLIKQIYQRYYAVKLSDPPLVDNSSAMRLAPLQILLEPNDP